MKKIWILICVAALLFALCACTDQKQGETSTTAKESTNQTDPAGNGQNTDPTEDTGSQVDVNPGDNNSDGWTKLY